MRLLIQHRSRYTYPAPAALGPQLVRLRPASHTRAKIETYALRFGAPPMRETDWKVHWMQDPYGNHVARVTFGAGTRAEAFEITVEMAVDVRPVNPFDFFIDERADRMPFKYPPELVAELAPFVAHTPPPKGSKLAALLASMPREGKTIDLVVELNRLVSQSIQYVIRDEAGVWAPEETLQNGRGSCRDSAVLLCEVLRSRGLAARFVSGYLVQLTDEGMIPDQPRGVGRDVVDLHAWAEVYLPGGGWIGLDATSGLLTGEGHIPLAATAEPAGAAPLEGTASHAAKDVAFELTVGRLGHEPRPTKPYVETVWERLLAAGDRADDALEAMGLHVTSGGEPTFNSREHPEAPEWTVDALGPTKWDQGRRLALELRRRMLPGAALMERMGKQYPGESLPRWVLEVIGRSDGQPVWKLDVPAPAGTDRAAHAKLRGEARKLASELEQRLGVGAAFMPAFEDPWHAIRDEAALPVNLDPLEADLDAPEERRRLAKILDKGLGEAAGFVLPLDRHGRRWVTETWSFRRGHMFLIPGDSPIGLRLPLGSLGPGQLPVMWEELDYPPDPRRMKEAEEAEEAQARLRVAQTPVIGGGVRTALCVEPRGGNVRVFLPPVRSADDFLALVAEIETACKKVNVDVVLEGYPPPPSPILRRISVSPDPGVLEVNVPPSLRTREHTTMMQTIFDAALHAGLHSEKYQLDGRQAGSGGGHHITAGGPRPLQSPFLVRPDILGSLLTFVQHHPSLSYLFTGLFVGPTSQAPRVDEARHDALYELEIALERAFEDGPGASPPPWLTDLLFRHLMVDVTGNTHRAEISLDKLFDPATPHGRQGLVELRAFEMPPHPQMASAQVVLVRNLIAALARHPYHHPLVRWGQTLHDRFLLPYWMWKDFEDVLAHLSGAGFPLDADGYRPFIDLRCPVAGDVFAGDVHVEVRNAIEPWHVLGEEMTGTGTSRYVDSSMERIEIRAENLIPERHAILINGRSLPMRPTGRVGEAVAGVRFRAWAPPHSLHPHLGIHHPIRIDVMDTWGRRSIGGASYHVWHPEGRGYVSPPLTRFEAAARRAQRFTQGGTLPWPVEPVRLSAHPDAPYSIDLRRHPRMDFPPPKPEKPEK